MCRCQHILTLTEWFSDDSLSMGVECSCDKHNILLQKTAIAVIIPSWSYNCLIILKL